MLDSVEHGETIVVTRAGRRVALISPAPRANGAALREVLCRWQHNPALDEAFASQVEHARQAVSAEADADPWNA
ncbi:MAG: type II toxin-antitoxin system Phd/YefM family antitoxin [Acidimicrobiales bacterium]